ncbi:uncharacterized protein [Amphiura filiformis]|uniref:uncharacterized protein n=1 Tax=Amphiura filiformis TaxID=82378 RepID=UPI003B220A85
MVYQAMFMLLLVSLTSNEILGQTQSTQDNQQQPETCEPCSCPCSNSGFLPGPMGPPGQLGVGLPGAQGPQGTTGPVGNPGSHGIPGIPGSQGLKGEKGDIGQGLKGQSGDLGQKGERGLTGEPGAKGDEGIMGLQGLTGQQGIMGLQGQKGNQGQVGVKGDQGEAGTSYTAPPMSAFSARKTSIRHISSGTEVITFEAEDLDVGNDFNPSTGVFTCRIQGLYYFSFSFYPDDDYDCHIYLDQNDVHKAKIYKSGLNGSYLIHSQSVILSLQVGDEVKLVVANPTYIMDSEDLTNIFNGYLIHAT